jgi:hypothetical protein
MRTSTKWLFLVVLSLIAGLSAPRIWSRLARGPVKSQHTSIVLAGSETLTLSRSRDYHLAGGNIDCPNCKDLYCSTFGPSAGKTITATRFLRMRSQGHWYRCQIQLSCGRAEFSDPNVPEQDCAGEANCNICRATDDGTEAEDDISYDWQ